MPQNRQYYRETKYPDKVAKPKCLVFVRIFLFCSVGIKIQYFPTAPFLFRIFFNKVQNIIAFFQIVMYILIRLIVLERVHNFIFCIKGKNTFSPGFHDNKINEL